jgi:hypothetical protein
MPAQFPDFYQSLDPDPLKRGKQFEHFVKWFLKTDPQDRTGFSIALLFLHLIRMKRKQESGGNSSYTAQSSSSSFNQK